MKNREKVGNNSGTYSFVETVVTFPSFQRWRSNMCARFTAVKIHDGVSTEVVACTISHTHTLVRCQQRSCVICDLYAGSMKLILQIDANRNFRNPMRTFSFHATNDNETDFTTIRFLIYTTLNRTAGGLFSLLIQFTDAIPNKIFFFFTKIRLSRINMQNHANFSQAKDFTQQFHNTQFNNSSSVESTTFNVARNIHRLFGFLCLLFQL